jgi:WD40 repeat protein
MALYSNDGFLRTWNAEERDLLSELNLGITGNSSVAFDKYGDLVMGAMRSMIQENDYGELTERVGGVGIWKTSSGDLITCVVYPCEGNAPLDEWQRHLISGATFDLKGRWVLSNYETLIGITDITEKETPYSISFTDIDANHREVALVTIDSLNDRFASAFIDGGILIQGLGQKNLDFLTPKIRLGDEQKASRHKISALVFSVDGQWLARLQDGIMSIWKLETRKGDLYFESSISDGKILTFDPSSELLFVARNDRIDIWNIRETQLIRELSAPEITSLSVSSDNRLLIWGDNLGAVHIWGVRR